MFEKVSDKAGVQWFPIISDREQVETAFMVEPQLSMGVGWRVLFVFFKRKGKDICSWHIHSTGAQK